jgi:hypothetical protein
VNPWLRRLAEDLALPSAEVGPVDFWALARLAAICAGVDMMSLLVRNATD